MGSYLGLQAFEPLPNPNVFALQHIALIYFVRLRDLSF